MGNDDKCHFLYVGTLMGWREGKRFSHWPGIMKIKASDLLKSLRLRFKECKCHSEPFEKLN